MLIRGNQMCEWCGHTHEQTALCTKRPKWSRRGFLALFGAGLVGMAVTGLQPLSEPDLVKLWRGLMGQDESGFLKQFDVQLNVETNLWLAT